MKRYLACLMIIVVLVIAVMAGCKKKSNNAVPAPNVSNFSATAPAAYTLNTAARVVISSTSLAAGNYTFRYHYNGDTSQLYAAAAVTMSNGMGSFQTPVITHTFATYLTIDSVFNSQNAGVPVTTNNLVTLSDSNGLMTALIADKSFRAVYVYTEQPGSQFSVEGIYYYPGSTSTKSIGFSISNFIGIAPYTFNNDFFGGSAYIVSNQNSVYRLDTARYGTITITATAPYVQGTFSFTTHDSTKVSGSFTGPQP